MNMADGDSEEIGVGGLTEGAYEITLNTGKVFRATFAGRDGIFLIFRDKAYKEIVINETTIVKMERIYGFL
jgi:hypothetical protein